MGELTQQERAAISEWLNKNKPVKYPTGISSIYDSYGNKRVTLKFRMAGIAKHIRSAIKKDGTLTHKDLAEHLVMPYDDVVAVCRKHNIKVKA